VEEDGVGSCMLGVGEDVMCLAGLRLVNVGYLDG